MQPVISSFIFSDDTQQVPASNNMSALHIVNPHNIIRPQFIPGGHSFSVSIGVLKMDPKKDHNIEFKLITPSKQTLIDTGKIAVPDNPSFDTKLPAEASGLMLNLDFRNLPVRENGEYKGVVIVNDTILSEYPLFIFAQELT